MATQPNARDHAQGAIPTAGSCSTLGWRATSLEKRAWRSRVGRHSTQSRARDPYGVASQDPQNDVIRFFATSRAYARYNPKGDSKMKYFIDTHDKTKGSFPTQVLTEEQFFEQFDELDRAAAEFHAFGHAAHVN